MTKTQTLRLSAHFYKDAEKTARRGMRLAKRNGDTKSYERFHDSARQWRAIRLQIESPPQCS